MDKDLARLLIRVFPISLIYPGGLIVSALSVIVLVGTFGFFVGGCDGFDSCYMNSFFEIFNAPKSWMILLLLWGVGLFFVYRQVYQDLK